jgi:DNA modification methylase
MKKTKFKNGICYLSDCLEVMKKLPDECVNLTITSPPYDNMRDYNGYSFPFEEIANELYRITTDGGVLVWNVFDQKTNGGYSLTSFKQVMYFVEKCGFKLDSNIIWDKGTFAAPNSKAYHSVYEYVFILTKGKMKTFNPLLDRPNKHGGKTVKVASKTQKDGTRPKSDRTVVLDANGKRFNIWQIPSEKRSNHPAPFPLSLVGDCILTWSNIGDTVLDPFGGSFTTAVQANKLDRRWITCEMSEEYYNKGIVRLTDD